MANTYDAVVAEHRSQEEGAEAQDLLVAMRMTVAEVPVYVAREQDECYTFACICGWRKTLHVDDLQACYERPFAPCGHDWECVECVG